MHLPSQDPVLLTFEEDESVTSELTVTQVSSFQKSANGKVSEEITFFFILLVCVSLTSVWLSGFLFSFCRVPASAAPSKRNTDHYLPVSTSGEYLCIDLGSVSLPTFLPRGGFSIASVTFQT